MKVTELEIELETDRDPKGFKSEIAGLYMFYVLTGVEKK